MNKSILRIVIAIPAILFLNNCSQSNPDQAFKAFRENKINDTLSIIYPFDGTLFPPEIFAPTFRWKETAAKTNRWLICIVGIDQGAFEVA